MNRHWIKLWINALDDARLATLDDTAWRVAVEIFLVAGEHGDSGKLPENSALAWRLRRDQSDMENILEQLRAVGLVRKLKHCYVVAKFKKRQSALSGADRQRLHRYKKAVTTRYENGNAKSLRKDKNNRKKKKDRNTTASPKKLNRYIEELNND
jgi:hypothetical protein